jgi:predicted protein tyrosine phosphatase
MKIDILSHKELVQRSCQTPPKNLIFISTPEHPFELERLKDAVSNIPNKLILLFDDVESEAKSPHAPRLQHTQDALRFAAGLDELVVSCHMGVSRSAAIAFGSVAQRLGITEAFRILNPIRHSPNRLIVEHVQEVLDLPYLSDAMKSWKSGQRKQFDTWIAEHHSAMKRREEFRSRAPIQ